MKNTYVLIALVALTVATATPLFAISEVVESRGTVQYQIPGSTQWRAAAPGVTLPEGTVVVSGSTGRARIRMGNTTVAVDPLSRVVIERAAFSPSEEDASLRMPYGRLTASVRRAAGRGMNFSVLTPISTAAVRGTEFSYDGYTLAVAEGDVSFANLSGQTHSVREGQYSRAWGAGAIESVEATLRESIDF
jgi:hypothetical protein